MAPHELKQMAPASSHEIEGRPSSKGTDDVNLIRLGKRPVLKRNFSLMSMLGFSCTILITWEGIVVYVPQNWHGTLLFWAVAVFSVGINSVGGNLLPRFEGLILILHILGFFAILIPLTYMADHSSRKEVFTQFLNLGDWPTQGLSFFIGLVGCVFAFAGGDAAVHMSEEITNAPVAVPRSIMLSVLINGTLGFSMLLAMLFCLGDIDKALVSPTGYPFMEIFLQATHSVAGTATMCSIITTMGICTSVGMLASTSRQFWSFARDRGIPGWRLWSKVTTKTAIPIYSVALTTIIACLLALINIGSSVAFNDLVSIRCTGGIGSSKSSDDTIVNTAGAKLVWGPFQLPGIWAFGRPSGLLLLIR
ncbi:hypothetical protein BBP40_000404 [Aspergillus hancockii]|nr:hypothetical protein BBP40_000404 [Aspergillus hancockii]